MRLALLMLALLSGEFNMIEGLQVEANAVPTAVITNSNSEEFIFTVEVPQTSAEFQQGLMFRTELSDSQGMLFAFPDSARRTFWMKNTRIALDIIFINLYHTDDFSERIFL